MSLLPLPQKSGGSTSECSDAPLEPSLLVSVRSVAEAAAAMGGAADVVDIKEPLRGPLGAADGDVIRAISYHIAGQVPLAACAGELKDLQAGGLAELTRSCQLWTVKIGLAGMRKNPDWKRRLNDAAAELPAGCQLVPVAYADWFQAKAPSPTEVSRYASGAGLRWVLVDTFDKSSGNLFARWDERAIQSWIHQARREDLRVALAGRLSGESIVQAAALQPDIIGVRGAVCRGARTEEVVSQSVAELKRQIVSASAIAVSNRNHAKKT